MHLQMKMAQSEKQVAEMTRSLEALMREKKELEMKERIMRDSLNGITEHMDHLFAHKASSDSLFFLCRAGFNATSQT